MGGGKNDVRVDAEFCADLVPVLDYGVRAVYNGAVEVKQKAVEVVR